MAAPATVSEFLDLVRQSDLVDSERLEEFLRHVRAGVDVPTRPDSFAHLLVGHHLLTRFQADKILQGKYRGFCIGDYRVLKPLGAGGMASVYQCAHRSDGHKVAVKILPKNQAGNSEVRKRFLREGRAVSALSHPNIVRAFEFGLDDLRHFLIMEYVEGWNLEEIVKKEGPPLIATACDWLRQAANGLQHIHERGMVHRDIKPTNLLLDRRGVVKIFDMGLARYFNPDEEQLTQQRVIGTADFIAPEQTYDSHGVDTRADIYSLGATAYFLLTGNFPFSGGTVDEKIINHRTKKPPLLTALRPDVPPGLTAVVEKMMAKEPDRRYQCPADVADALRPWWEE